jgi:hypothetical protein
VAVGDQLEGVQLDQVRVQARDWVRLSAELFTPVYSPTTAVQRISERLLSSDASEEVPALAFLKACVDEFAAARSSQATKAKRKPTTEPLAKLFYKRPSGLLNLPPRALPSLPQRPPRKAPASFDILAFGKSRFQEPRIKAPVFDTDEELFHASTDEEAVRASQLPRKITPTAPFEPGEFERLRDENDYLLDKAAKTEAALEESISFCDQIAIEHDLLMQQNSKLKRLLSVVTDRLVRASPALLKDLDFSEVLNDPCKDFKATGILKQLEEPEESLELPLQHSPPSPSFSPKHFIGGDTEDDDILVAILPNSSTHPKMLSFAAGARILKLGEAQGWLLGEDLGTGRRGYFPPTCVTRE